MTVFEKKIAKRIRKFEKTIETIEFSEICKNVYKTVGEFPTDAEIDFEIEEYYIDDAEFMERLNKIPGIEFGELS